LARKAYGNHLTQVNLSTYPDDGTSPVGSAEWNEALDNEGMLGFTPATADSSTIIIASGVATITDSVSVIAGESAATDTLQKLALANTSQYDLVYLFAASGSYNITLEHGDLNADGEISTVSGSNETLSTTVPTILIRKGNYWYGYGGGVVNAVSDIGDVTISGIASGEVLKWNGSAWINNTLAEAGVAASGAKLSDFAATTSAELAGIISDETGSGALAFATSPTFVTPALGTPSALVGTSITGTASGLTSGNVTTNANLTGEVTSSGNAATIAGNIVDEANLKVSNAPTNGLFLSAQSGNTGGLTWAAAGGTHTEQGWDVYTTHTGTATTADGIAYMFTKVIDSSNDGLFIMLWKNGASTEVQIA
jgi:hypothetical protein